MSKYKSQKIVVDGYTFDSKIEAKYYEKLKQDKAKGSIENFELQPRFTLINKFKNSFNESVRAIEYKADFIVYELDGTQTVIDIKGIATPEAKLKRKLFWYMYQGEDLKWLVWHSGEWKDYDQVQKLRREKKKAKEDK